MPRDRPITIQDKSASERQITAEQIIHEAYEQQEPVAQRPDLKIIDRGELLEYQLEKRTTFEKRLIRRSASRWRTFIKYAKWEENQGELTNSRSVFERALDADYRTHPQVWIAYAEMEMRNHNINAARNVWERAVTLLPRYDDLWLNYALFLEGLGQAQEARRIFERWITWKPGARAWFTYAKMELRYGEVDRARYVMQRFTQEEPGPASWLRFCKFEEKGGRIKSARAMFERAAAATLAWFGDEDAAPFIFGVLGDETIPPRPDDFEGDTERYARMFEEFALFEERHGEPERGRRVLKLAEKHVFHGAAPPWLSGLLLTFEKRYGDTEGIMTAIYNARRDFYAKSLAEDPFDYDMRLDHCQLEMGFVQRLRAREATLLVRRAALRSNSRVVAEIDGADAAPVAEEIAREARAAIEAENPDAVALQDAIERVSEDIAAAITRSRAVFEDACAHSPQLDPRFAAEAAADAATPLSDELERSWRRHLWTWVWFGAFEEVAARDHAAALEVYDGGLAVVPYRRVQFPQLWIEAARCALRGGDLAAARRRFGLAIARCPCSEVFDAYVALETDLGNAGRVRTILQRRLEIFPREAKSWVLVARHEAETDQRERERAVLELAAAESATLDFPDVIWKHLLEMEMRRGDTERVRAVYERLCAQSLAARAWISWAQFEASQGDIGAARRVFEEAEGKFRAESTPITGENEAAAAQVRSERAVALGAWLELEEAVEDEAELARVRALQPRVVQVQRPVAGVEGVLEECEDFVFPEMDEEAGGGQRIAGIAESMGGLDDLF